MKNEHECPRRVEAPYQITKGPDTWDTEMNGDRTCSYCGSLHPEDMERLTDLALNPDNTYRIEVSTKRYKVYITQPDVENATQGGIKFYAQHLPEGRQDLVDKINKANGISKMKFQRDVMSQMPWRQDGEKCEVVDLDSEGGDS